MVGRPFQPGQSGNPSGRPKTKPFKDALHKALKAAGDDQDLLEAVAKALVGKAMAGDVPAIKELADRMDGKVAQPVEGGDAPIEMIHRIERIIVQPSDQDG